MPVLVRKFLERQGCNPRKFIYVGRDAESYVFRCRRTGRITSVRR